MLRAALALLVLALCAVLPRLDASDWRGTEGRRVQIAYEMAHSGEWMVPTLGHEPTFAKPPLHYWILAALIRVDFAPWLLRLPSVLGFWALAVCVFASLRRTAGERAGWIGAVGVLLSPTVLYHLPSAEIDPLFAALTAISLLWMAEGAAFGRRLLLVAGGAVGGLALLSKGPPYFLFVFGAGLVWLRRLRLAGVLWYLVPLIAVPLCYFVPLALVRDAGKLAEVASEESVGRLAFFSWDSVLHLPGYGLRVLGMLMPLGWWTFHEIRGLREMREAVLVERDEAFLRMCAGAMVGAVLLLVLFPARPPRYLLPGVPLYLVAVAPAVAEYVRRGRGISRVLGRGLQGLAIAASLVLPAAPWLPYPYDKRTPFLLLVLAMAPIWVRTRRQVALFALLAPLVAAWTVLPDHADRRSLPPHGFRQAGAALQRAMDGLGVRDLETRGHIASQILLAIRRFPPADEHAHDAPAARWVLVEGEYDPPMPFDHSRFPGYRDRVHVRTGDKSLVLRERR